VRRNNRFEHAWPNILHLIFQGAEDTEGVSSGKVHAQRAAHFLHFQANDLRRQRCRIGVHQTLADRTAGMLGHQVGGPRCGRQDRLRMNALAEAHAGLAGQVELFHGAANADEVEAGRLQQDVPRLVADLGVRAAHDAGEGNGAAHIGNDQIVPGQLPLLPVQSHEDFAGTGRPYRDDRCPALRTLNQQIEIEGMQRLAPLQHDVVGEIDNIVDGPHAGIGEPPLHPAGGRTDFDPLDQRGGVPGRQLGILNQHADLASDHFALLETACVRQLERLSRDRRHLAGHADHGQAASQVRCHLQLQNDIPHEVGQRHADRCIVLQDDDALVLVGNAQFLEGADHGIGRDAANLRRLQFLEDFLLHMAVEQDGTAQGDHHLLPLVSDLDVGRTGDQRLGPAFPISDDGQREPIGIGMAFHFEDFADQDLVLVPHRSGFLCLDVQTIGRRQAQHLDAGHFQTRQSKTLGQGSRGQAQVYVFAQPGERNFHGGIVTATEGMAKSGSDSERETHADIDELDPEVDLIEVGHRTRRAKLLRGADRLDVDHAVDGFAGTDHLGHIHEGVTDL